MDAETQRAWFAFLRLPGVGPAVGAQLLDRFGSPADLFAAGARAWRAAGLADVLVAALATPDWAAADGDLAWVAQPDRCLLVRDDPAFPSRLRAIASSPLALYVVGDTSVLQTPQVAIVGARSASAQGLDNARAFAAELARRGLTITSGLALGVDGAAHAGALDAGGQTIAICGNGLDRVYPARHRELAHRIASGGALVSELAPGTPPRPEHFPRRNRLISGLALGVLVVEAARESGSLITARLAAEQGREVFAIPGSIHNPMSRGCHALIREGARLVETADDILEELAPQLRVLLAERPATGPAPGDDARAQVEDSVLAAIDDAATPFDVIVARTGLDAASLNARLLALELDGAIGSGPGDTFMRRKHR
jgi:DNA processing protein